MSAERPVRISPISAEVMSVAAQLEALETLAPAERDAVMYRQIDLLIAHAREHSPFWRDRLPPDASASEFERLPVLTRAGLRDHGDDIRTTNHPGRVRVSRTSGSTGLPVEVVKSAPASDILFAAQYLRYHAWHGMEADCDMLTILDTEEGPKNAGWSHTLRELGHRGRRFRRNMMAHPPETLLAWLLEQDAPYLTTTATMALQLARLAMETPARTRRLKAVLTFGEVVRAEHREAVREAFGAGIIDCYSCEEAGWLAFQCPRHDHYHSLSSTVHVEIVDDDGRAVAPGGEGRVLVTDLYNVAMPLIRYDIGDRAIAGSGCDCGLTLPVISEILGRERSLLVLPDGSRRLARLTGEYWRRIAPVQEYRVVQYPDNGLEAFVRADRKLSVGEKADLEAMLHRTLHPGLSVRITQVDTIPWDSRWKRIDIVRTDHPREERP